MRLSLLLYLACLVGLQAPLAAVTGPGYHATVLSIGDGDTIRVLDRGRKLTIRLACIDAPEMAQSPHGAQSRAYLQTRLHIGSPETLLPQTVDRYDRSVAELIGDLSLNLAMVEDGQTLAFPEATPAISYTRNKTILGFDSNGFNATFEEF
jgi:endonuclease YncB( thermonuclease family)